MPLRFAVRATLIGLCCAGLAACASGRCRSSPPEARPPVAGELDTAVAPYLTSLERSGVSGVVLASRGETVLLRRSFGLADHRCGTPSDPSYAFDIGSIAKTFTAAAIYLLAEDGALGLDDPIAKHLPDAPADKGGITVRQLLTHGSGLRNYHAPGDFTPMGRRRAERRSFAGPLRFEPGADEAYSNAGYALLAAIIERTSGRKFPDFVATRLLAPIGLDHTGWFGSTRTPAARGRANGRDRGTPTDYRLTWALIGGGGMTSTLDDLRAWTRALFAGSLLRPASVADMLEAPRGRWTAGWEVHETPFGKVIRKGGSGEHGFTSQVRYYPEHDVTIVVLLNAYVRPDEGNTHNVVGARLEALVLPRLVPV